MYMEVAQSFALLIQKLYLMSQILHRNIHSLTLIARNSLWYVGIKILDMANRNGLNAKFP